MLNLTSLVLEKLFIFMQNLQLLKMAYKIVKIHLLCGYHEKHNINRTDKCFV